MSADGAPTAVEASRAKVRGFVEGLAALRDDEVGKMCVLSPAVHFATCVKIFNKKNELVRPVPNILQLRMSEVYEFFREIDRPCRMVVCKPRQVGCSTFGGQIGVHMGKTRKVNGLIIADKKDNSINLVQRLEEYHQHDRFPWGIQMKAGAEEINLSNKTVFAVDTAENPKAGIGRTRQFLHCSEIGKWPKTTVKSDKRTMGAVLPSVPKDGFNVVIAESTPEGAAGFMYETWQGAVSFDDVVDRMCSGESNPGNGWVKVFAAWFEFVEHTIENVTGRALSDAEVKEIQRTLTLREREGIEKYGWTWSQVAWRRYILNSECGGDEDLLDEYYPEDEVRCWNVSGRPRFSVEGLNRMEMEAKSHPAPLLWKLYETEGGRTGYSPVSTVGEADAVIYEEPRAGMAYLVGVDPATGASQTNSKDPDSHSIQVWRRGYWDGKTSYRHKLVARVVPKCRWEVKQAAEAVAGLSRLYGLAPVVLEINMGLGFMELLQAMGIPLYEREVLDPNMPNRNEPKRQIGFKLKDQNLRDALIETLASAIRERTIEVPCLNWIQEARTFIRADDGKSQARPGTHDDDVLCGAMALYTLPSAKILTETMRRSRLPRDYYRWNRHQRPSGPSTL